MCVTLRSCSRTCPVLLSAVGLRGGPGAGAQTLAQPRPYRMRPTAPHCLTPWGLHFLFSKIRLMGVPAAAGMVASRTFFAAFGAGLGQVLALVELAVV